MYQYKLQAFFNNIIMENIKKIIKIYKKEKLTQIAGNMSFKLTLSLFPFFLIALNILTMLNLDFGEITSEMHGYIPEEVIYFLETLESSPGLSVISFFILFYNAIRGFSVMVNGINSIYEKDGAKNEKKTRSAIRLYSTSFLLSLLFVGSLVVSIFLKRYSIFIIFITVLLINMLSIRDRVKIKYLLKGSIFVTLAWVIISYGFNIYISNFSNMHALYGSIAGIMVMLIWLNLICNTLLFGSVLNTLKDF